MHTLTIEQIVNRRSRHGTNINGGEKHQVMLLQILHLLSEICSVRISQYESLKDYHSQHTSNRGRKDVIKVAEYELWT